MSKLKKENDNYFGQSLNILNYIESICKQQAALYGYQEIKLSTYNQSSCQDDRIINRADKLIHLLSVIKNNNNELINQEIVKYYSFAVKNVGTSENYKFSVLNINREDNFSDIENIQLALSILDKLNIKYKIYYNYIGCSTCLNKYKEQVMNLLNENDPNLRLVNIDNICLLLNSYKDSINLPKIDFCNKCSKEINSLENGLNQYIFNINKNDYLTLIEKSDEYKSKLIFEIKDEKGNLLISGGRLDNLYNYKSVSMKDIGIVGFSINIENLQKLVRLPEEQLKLDVLILIEKMNFRLKAFDLVKRLRDANFKADILMKEKQHRLMYTRKYLLEQSSRIIICLEEKQMKRDIAIVKDLNNNTSIAMPLNSIIPALNGMLNKY